VIRVQKAQKSETQGGFRKGRLLLDCGASSLQSIGGPTNSIPCLQPMFYRAYRQKCQGKNAFEFFIGLFHLTHVDLCYAGNFLSPRGRGLGGGEKLGLNGGLSCGTPLTMPTKSNQIILRKIGRINMSQVEKPTKEIRKCKLSRHHSRSTCTRYNSCATPYTLSIFNFSINS